MTIIEKFNDAAEALRRVFYLRRFCTVTLSNVDGIYIVSYSGN